MPPSWREHGRLDGIGIAPEAIAPLGVPEFRRVSGVREETPMLRVTPEITLADGDIRERFVPSAGSSSRKEARHATAVELRLDIRRATLPPEVKRRLLALGGRRVTTRGVLVVISRTHRLQQRNREVATERLIAIIRAAARPVKPRLPTAPPRVARPPRTTGRSHTGLHRAVASTLL
jgi:ribosome-associated protein